MSSLPRIINSLLIPLSARPMLLPQAAIAEVIKPVPVRALAGAAQWLDGVFDWRREQIPLVSLEEMCGVDVPAVQPTRYVVLYGVEGHAGLGFYALKSYGIPRSLKISAEALLKGDGEGFDCEFASAHVLHDGQPAFIPNLGTIEAAIRAQLQRM